MADQESEAAIEEIYEILEHVYAEGEYKLKPDAEIFLNEQIEQIMQSDELFALMREQRMLKVKFAWNAEDITTNTGFIHTEAWVDRPKEGTE